MKPQSSLQLLLKAKYLRPDRAAEMLRPVISILRHVEPHGIEAHEASIALSVLIESLRSETGVLETLYDRLRTALLFSRASTTGEFCRPGQRQLSNRIACSNSSSER